MAKEDEAYQAINENSVLTMKRQLTSLASQGDNSNTSGLQKNQNAHAKASLEDLYYQKQETNVDNVIVQPFGHVHKRYRQLAEYHDLLGEQSNNSHDVQAAEGLDGSPKMQDESYQRSPFSPNNKNNNQSYDPGSNVGDDGDYQQADGRKPAMAPKKSPSSSPDNDQDDQVFLNESKYKLEQKNQQLNLKIKNEQQVSGGHDLGDDRLVVDGHEQNDEQNSLHDLL